MYYDVQEIRAETISQPKLIDRPSNFKNVEDF